MKVLGRSLLHLIVDTYYCDNRFRISFTYILFNSLAIFYCTKSKMIVEKATISTNTFFKILQDESLIMSFPTNALSLIRNIGIKNLIPFTSCQQESLLHFNIDLFHLVNFAFQVTT